MPVISFFIRRQTRTLTRSLTWQQNRHKLLIPIAFGFFLTTDLARASQSSCADQFASVPSINVVNPLPSLTSETSVAAVSSIKAEVSSARAAVSSVASGQKLDLKQFGTPVTFPFYGFAGRGRLMTLKPRDGIGHYIVLNHRNLESSLETGFRIWLVEAALKAPDFFRQFDIHVDSEVLILPSPDRMNPLMKNGLQFEDAPLTMSQPYSKEFFHARFLQGYVPLAQGNLTPLRRWLKQTDRDYFSHDRADNHTLGALILPPRMVQELNHYANLEHAIRSDKALADFFKPTLKKAGFPIFISDQYDSITAELGSFAKTVISSRFENRTREEAIDLRAQQSEVLEHLLTRLYLNLNTHDILERAQLQIPYSGLSPEQQRALSNKIFTLRQWTSTHRHPTAPEILADTQEILSRLP